MIVLDDVSFDYPLRNVFKNLSLHVRKGEIFSLIGPSGCGKSTLLKMMAGMLLPTKGKILVDGKLPRPSSEIGFVIQDFGLFPWKTVWENLLLGLTLKKKKDTERIHFLLEEIELAAFKNVYPEKLSGGQKQRVAIARALLLEPKILLMDEPFSALDSLTRESLQEMLLSLRDKHHLTIVLVTHNIEEAVFLSDRIAINHTHVIEASPRKRTGQAFYTSCEHVRALLKKL